MLFRFQIELSDVDRGVYETLDFRVAQHPSETHPYLLTRVLAYALAYEEGLEFSAQGLGDPEAPAILKYGAHQSVATWIEIGNPTSRKLHKATKSASRVSVFTYKNPDVLRADIQESQVHRASEIEIVAVEPAFLDELSESLEKNNRWSLLVQSGQVDVTVAGRTHSTQLRQTHA